jgi:hypothetical protein
MEWFVNNDLTREILDTETTSLMDALELNVSTRHRVDSTQLFKNMAIPVAEKLRSGVVTASYHRRRGSLPNDSEAFPVRNCSDGFSRRFIAAEGIFPGLTTAEAVIVRETS